VSNRPQREKPRQEPRQEKLHKVLADRGFGSRREMERWIAAGRVRVNDDVAHLGKRVSPADDIAVDGRKLAPTRSQDCRVLVANKRAGVVVSRRDSMLPSIFDELPKLRHARWVSVGRLDVQTTGLILFTNDGDMANALMHPSAGIDREYAVRVDSKLDGPALRRLREGVLVDGRNESFSDIRYYDGSGGNHWYHVVLMEGRHREVRRLFASVGVNVTRLKRVRFGPVVLPPWLPRGAWEEMRSRDVRKLRRILGLANPRTSQRHSSAGGRTMLIPYPALNRSASGETAERTPPARQRARRSAKRTRPASRSSSGVPE